MATVRYLRPLCVKTANYVLSYRSFHPSLACMGVHQRTKRKTWEELYRRRVVQGPEPERHRSVWPNWNYGAEVFAFSKRLGEDFNKDTLKRVFTDRSYTPKKADQFEELGVVSEMISNSLNDDNTELVENGRTLTTEYIKAYLRHQFPRVPEEGICCITSYLTEVEKFANISRHIGTSDLILCEEFPVSDAMLSKTLFSVIGGLAADQGQERAHAFVLDFVITQLVGKTLDEIWQVPDPMGLLAGILRKNDQAEPEPRLLWHVGSETMCAAYMVGIYCDKKLIGKSPGESITIAEEMAARDALRQYFGLTIAKEPLKFGAEGYSLPIELGYPNPSLQDIQTAALPSQ